MRILNYLVFFLVFNSVLEAQETSEVSRRWTSFVQVLDIESSSRKNFKVIGSIKVETEDSTAWAGIWARIDTKDNESGFFDNMGDRPVSSDVWQSYEVNGVLDENSKRLNFGGLCQSNGKFYFDKFELYVENESGELERVEIENPDFETKINDKSIPKWNQGISKEKTTRVKEYHVSSSQDKASGMYSLLIEGSGIKPDTRGTIPKVEGASPQIGAMISMLENLKSRVEYAVSSLSQYELDHLHDEDANRIGALIMHLAAAEKLYQVISFEGRRFNEEEKEEWEAGLNLGDEGRNKFKGHNVQYYLDIYNEVRLKTIEELKKRDDKWFEEVQLINGLSNHYCWFHVMEHQSSHLGQILFLKKRIPPNPAINIKKEIKN